MFAEIVSSGEWAVYPHLVLLDELVRSHLAGETGKDILLVSMPPRHGKSQYISRYLPAWYLWRWPRRHVILTSYAAEFAATWGRRAREAFNRATSFIPSSGPNQDKQASHEWETLHGGGMKTAGVLGDITGRPANLLLFDDLIKNDEEAGSETIRTKTWEWLRGTALPRMEPGAKAIGIGTRWHRDDYQSRLLRPEWTEDVLHVNMPAIAEGEDPLGRAPGEALWPRRWSLPRLAKKRRQVGEYWWLAEYQGRPTQSDRAEWPESYFTDDIWVTDLPGEFEFCVIAIDPARGNTTKGSFVPDVLVGWSGDKFYVWADVARRPIEDAAESAVFKATQFRTDLVYVEGNGAQYLVADVVARKAYEAGLPHLVVQAFDSTVNKLDRIRRLGPRLSARQFRFLDCTGCRLLVEQMKDFPIADFMDGPDCLEMAVRKLIDVARETISNHEEDDDEES